MDNTFRHLLTKTSVKCTLTISCTNGTATPSGTITLWDGESVTVSITENSGYTDSKTISNNNCTYTGSYTVTPDDGATTASFSVTCNKASSQPCLAGSSQVLLANGTTKQMRDITYDDLLWTYDPYLGKFVAQYPVVVEGPCNNEMVRLTFENGQYIDICGSHTIYEMGQHTFKTVWAKESRQYENNFDPDNFYGAFYSKEERKFVPVKLVSIEKIDSIEDSYNVFTPMHGSIITNGFCTGGNFLMYEPVENFLKKGKNTDNWDRDLCKQITTGMTDDLMDENWAYYNSILAKYDIEMPERLFKCSNKVYAMAAKNAGFPFGAILGDMETTALNDSFLLKRWKPILGKQPDKYKILLDNEVIAEVLPNQEFTFPNNYNKYIDLSTYRIFNKGERTKFYTSTAIHGLE